jgi:hypothetical protein
LTPGEIVPRATGRATQGVRLINLENGDTICSVAKAEES